LVILAARPSMGKTAVALSYAHGVAAQGHGVTFASLEMRAAQLGGRLACDVLFDSEQGRVPYSAVSSGTCTAEQRRSMTRAAMRIEDWPLWIEDLPSATTGRLAAIVRRHKRRLAARGKSLRLVIVDYLQLLSPDRRGKSLYEDTSAVSRALKALAKAEGVGVLALCQLSRGIEQRSDKRPTLADMRDSGQIEQDADSVVFLLRREEYLRAAEPDPGTADWVDWRHQFDGQQGKIEFIVAKRRAGLKSTGFGLWHGAYQAVRG
jgi:replicative DNA helicase